MAGKTYKVHLPPNIPVKTFWSFVVYDNQTRSELQTDEEFPSIGSQKKGIVINSDTSVDVYFGPPHQRVTKRTGCRPFPEKDGRYTTSLRPAPTVVRQDVETR